MLWVTGVVGHLSPRIKMWEHRCHKTLVMRGTVFFVPKGSDTLGYKCIMLQVRVTGVCVVGYKCRTVQVPWEAGYEVQYRCCELQVMSYSGSGTAGVVEYRCGL